MKYVEVFTWLMPPPAWTPKGKPHKSRWKMTVEEAATFSAIAPVDGSMEIRRVDLTLEEQRSMHTNAWQTSKP